MADKSVVDRLSSLPNDILIDIVSRLPIRFAIATECLSSRWRGLWTNITSVYVINRLSETFSEFSAAFDDVVSQIQSPNIYNLTLHFIDLQKSQSYDYSWLREICDRNLCKLKLTWPKGCYRRITKLPSFIFQTSSLVSIELDTKCAWEFPDDDSDSNPINLPNLRYLRFHFSDCELLHKLIKACPSLEELSLKCNFYEYYTTFNCSNPNLRRLTVDLYFNLEVEVVINAPKLEYLAIYSLIRVTLKFEEKSIGLRELKILGKGCPPEETFVSEINGIWSIYNVRFLTLDVYTLHNISTRFCYVTQVSLDMYWTHDIEIVVHLMELCPVLDVLFLKCLMEDSEDDMVQTSDNTSTFLTAFFEDQVR